MLDNAVMMYMSAFVGVFFPPPRVCVLLSVVATHTNVDILLNSTPAG